LPNESLLLDLLLRRLLLQILLLNCTGHVLLLLLLWLCILMQRRVMGPFADTTLVVAWAGLHEMLRRQAVQTKPLDVDQTSFLRNS
jgi:hypothetical protein